MILDITPPLAGTLEYKLSTCFFKGGGSSKPPANTSQEKAVAEIALKRYQRYMDVYRPLEDVAIADVTGDAAAQRIEGWAGNRLNADAAQVMAANQAITVDPSGQMPQMAMMDNQRAAAVAKSGAEIAGLGRKQKIGGLQTAVGIGTGQAADTQLAFKDLAGSALEQSIKNSELSLESNLNRTQAQGSVVGAIGAVGMNAYDKYKAAPKA